MNSQNSNLLIAWIHLLIVAGILFLSDRILSTGPNPLIDYGRDPYLLFASTQGLLPVREVMYSFGFFPWAFMKLWSQAFGFAPQSLLFMNGTFLLAGISLFWVGAKRFQLDPYARSFAILIFVFQFALASGVPLNHYNFFFPYTHSILFAFWTALAALGLLVQETTNRLRMLGVGVLLSLSVFSKFELGIAGLLSVLIFEGLDRKTAIRSVLSTVLGFGWGVLVLFIWAGFLYGPGAWGNLNHSIASFLSVANGYSKNPYYLWVTGRDEIMANAAHLLWSGGILLLWTFPFLGFAQRSRWRWISILLGGLMLGMRPEVHPLRGLPILVAVFWVKDFLAIRSGRIESKKRLLLGSFGFLCLLKILFKAEPSHYGFVLLAPGTLYVFFSLWKAGEGEKVLRVFASFLAMVLGLSAVVRTYQMTSSQSFRLKAPVGEVTLSRDHIWLEPLIAYLQKQDLQPGALAVLPEGVWINSLLRVTSPLYITGATPIDYESVGGDPRMLRDLEKRPRFILLFDRNYEEYGSRGFGLDYAQPVIRWIQANYLRVPKEEISISGLVILKRKD